MTFRVSGYVFFQHFKTIISAIPYILTILHTTNSYKNIIIMHIFPTAFRNSHITVIECICSFSKGILERKNLLPSAKNLVENGKTLIVMSILTTFPTA